MTSIMVRMLLAMISHLLAKISMNLRRMSMVELMMLLCISFIRKLGIHNVFPHR